MRRRLAMASPHGASEAEVLEVLKRAYALERPNSARGPAIRNAATTQEFLRLVQSDALSPEPEPSPLCSYIRSSGQFILRNPVVLAALTILAHAIVGGIAQGFPAAKIASYAIWQMRLGCTKWLPAVGMAQVMCGIVRSKTRPETEGNAEFDLAAAGFLADVR